MSLQQSCIKKTKNTNSKNKIVFCSKCNPLGPKIKNIIQKHPHILDNCQIMQNKEIMVAYKREKKLKELQQELILIISLIMLMMKCTHVIHVQTLWSQKVVLNISLQRVYKIRQSTSCVSKNVIYIAFCLNCLKQGVGSTVDWKPRLQNYKSHIKKTMRSCSIVNHFIDVCSDTDDPSRNIRFNIIDQLNNANSISPDHIDDLLLQKERF